MPHYSRLLPVPSTLPISPQSANIANSIFAQSQLRQAPLPAIGTDITNAGNNLATFLSSEHVVEDISKIARNLLSLPGSNQVCLNDCYLKVIPKVFLLFFFKPKH